MVVIAKTKIVSIALLALTLAACAPATVKDIAADKPGYLSRNFSPSQLPPDVLKQVTARQASVSFNRIKMKFRADLENVDGLRKVTQTSDVTYQNVGNGLVQVFKEYASNDIPYSNAYELSYLGFLQLRSQTVNNNQYVGNYIVEVKHFNLMLKNLPPVREDKEYVLEWSSGNTIQIANYIDRKAACTSSKTYAASDLFATLPGKAIDVQCEFTTNGSVYLKQTLTYLQQYGLFVLKSFTNTTAKAAYTITAAEIS
jgi:hypothetical protein